MNTHRSGGLGRGLGMGFGSVARSIGGAVGGSLLLLAMSAGMAYAQGGESQATIPGEPVRPAEPMPHTEQGGLAQGEQAEGRGGPPALAPQATLELWGLTLLGSDFDQGSGDVSATFGRAELNMSIPVGGTKPGDARVVSFIAGTQVASYDFSVGALQPPQVPPPSGDAVWDTLYGMDVSVAYRAPIDERWGFIVGAGVESSFEAGADFGDTLTYGGFGAVTYAFSPELIVGGGAFVSTRLEDDVRVIPAPFIRWRASERVSVTSGAGTGPTGPGVSVFYAIDEAWTAGVSVGFRSIAARLDDQGPAPDGVGRHDAVPIVASVTWKASETIELTALAGVVVGQTYELLDASGNMLIEDDADPAPAFAVLAKIVF